MRKSDIEKEVGEYATPMGHLYSWFTYSECVEWVDGLVFHIPSEWVRDGEEFREVRHSYFRSGILNMLMNKLGFGNTHGDIS